MVRKNSAEDDRDTSDDCEVIEKVTNAIYSSATRRRLEEVLEERALERLINSDYYD